MKQTLEEAAIKHQNGFSTCEDASVLGAFSNGMHHQSYKSFIAGADWQAKQYPWISVKERPPKHNIEVIICHEREFYIGKMYHSMQSNWWRVSDDERTDIIVSEDDSWMPIPSFDEILEANKDVLERIKEKGDCHDSKERIL